MLCRWNEFRLAALRLGFQMRFCREIGILECVENQHESQADQKQGLARTVTRVVDDSWWNSNVFVLLKGCVVADKLYIEFVCCALWTVWNLIELLHRQKCGSFWSTIGNWTKTQLRFSSYGKTLASWPLAITSRRQALFCADRINILSKMEFSFELPSHLNETLIVLVILRFFSKITKKKKLSVVSRHWLNQ